LMEAFLNVFARFRCVNFVVRRSPAVLVLRRGAADYMPYLRGHVNPGTHLRCATVAFGGEDAAMSRGDLLAHKNSRLHRPRSGPRSFSTADNNIGDRASAPASGYHRPGKSDRTPLS